jgi:hypothetical protein
MTVALSLSSNELDDEKLQNIALELCKTLERETDVAAKLAEGPSLPGTKGEPIILATIILSFITSGAAVAMFNVFKSYFDRNSTLEMEFQRKDGRKFRIQAQNVSPKQLDHTIQQAKDFMSGIE